jgi:hypothetical protein
MITGASENTQIQIGSNLNENLIMLIMFWWAGAGASPRSRPGDFPIDW